MEIEKLKKPAKKEQKLEKKKVKEKKETDCPDCGAKLKTTALPHGDLVLCVDACGFRRVVNKKNKNGSGPEMEE